MEYIHKNSNPKIKVSYFQSSIALKNELINQEKNNIRICYYRPFVKRYLYFNEQIIENKYRWLNIFLQNNTKNILIATSGTSESSDFSCLAIKELTDLHFIGTAQCYPLYWYKTNKEPNLFVNDSEIKDYTINLEIVTSFKEKYNDLNITAFHIYIYIYIYAMLHSKIYQQKYYNNLTKESPRIPYLKDFWKYVEIGQKLMDLHVNYEEISPYQNVEIDIKKEDYTIKKLKFSNDRTEIKFNEYITIKNIPTRANQYKVGGKSPLEWIVNQYKYSVDPESGIVNDPNKFDEIKGGKYVFDLILSLITLSLGTLDLIAQLPEYQEI
ncbi:Type ISP restriction/modification enzyme, C-terminal specificity domain [[Mycoplasma] cavipharyngis]|uniref:type ISP restriction/modification enzyme n=1 Tax=[Mycoplasma] cavipharyngis TaxID=92757 RepID=UPI003704823B